MQTFLKSTWFSLEKNLKKLKHDPEFLPTSSGRNLYIKEMSRDMKFWWFIMDFKFWFSEMKKKIFS